MYFKYKNIDLYYEKHGCGEEELIILPGWGDARKSFDYLISTLEDYYTIYIVDYPGFGNTNFPSHDLTIYDYSEMIHEWIKSLNLNNPTILGHSFGGRILITLTGYYNYPYDKIILIASAGIKPKRTLKSKLRVRLYKVLMKIAKIFPKKWALDKKLFNHFSSSDYRALKPNVRKTFQNIVNEDLKDYIPNIVSNTLIIWGKNDDSTPIKDAFYMQKNIRKAKLYTYDGGHFVYIEHFQEVLEHIVKFIEND